MSEGVQFPKSMTLEELSVDVGSHEGNVGRLIAISRTEDYTVAEYEVGYTPVNSAELIDSGEEVPEGFEEVCRGECWDAEEEKDCIAIRKTA